MKASKKILLCCMAVLVSVLLMSLVCTASEDIGDPITLNVNGTLVEGAVLTENGAAYAPFRALVSALDPDAVFCWSPALGATVATGSGIQIAAYDGQNYIDANGRILYLPDVTTRNLNGTLYTAVRPVCTAYSLPCVWDEASQTVTVTGIGKPIAAASEFYDENDLYWLSRIISAESRGESLVGQIAVGNVVLNRTEDGSFPDTIYDVIFDRKHGTQFSPAVSGAIYRKPTDLSVLAAKIVLEGANVVEDALYFCPKTAKSTSWIVRTRSLVETIGNHSFYA